jgi:L-asparaginase
MLILCNGEARGGIDAGIATLKRDGSALDTVEQTIRPVEHDVAIHSVGRGGHPNLLGDVECDATIMDGVTRETGSVGALQGYLYAISVARAVMHDLPHVLLVGPGATRFAREIDATPAPMLTDEARAWYEAWLARSALGGPGSVARPSGRNAEPPTPDAPLTELAWSAAQTVISGGTAVVLAIDGQGRIAAGASSSGFRYKYPGRLGDSAVVGAGVYADQRYGACACTHTGEMTIRAGTSRAVVLAMQRGATVEEACHEAVADLRALRGGLLGAVIVHAIDARGATCVVSTHAMKPEMDACEWRPGMPGAKIQPVPVAP